MSGTFNGSCTVSFINNRADDNGGVVYIKNNSEITFKGISTATFCHNHADVMVG